MELKEQYNLLEEDLNKDYSTKKLLQLLKLYAKCSLHYKWYNNPAYYGEDYSIEHLNKIITENNFLSQEK